MIVARFQVLFQTEVPRPLQSFAERTQKWRQLDGVSWKVWVPGDPA
jgi:hypothetical protein